MRRIAFFIMCLFMLNSYGVVFAATYVGKVDTIQIRDSDGLISVEVIGNKFGTQPDCAKYNYLLIKNENSPTGKRQLALLMLAIATKKIITITGAGTCTRWPDGEDINSIAITK